MNFFKISVLSNKTLAKRHTLLDNMNIKTNKLCYFTIYWKWGDVRNGIVLGETLQKKGGMKNLNLFIIK